MKRLILSSSLIVGAVFLLDQVTKYYIKAQLGYFDIITVTPFFNIVYAENTGSAFGMFKSFGAYFFIGVSLAAVIFLAVLIVKDRGNSAAYSLLLGGAAGNLIDRFIRGYVIDFLDFHLAGHHWPAFNIADSALTVGITILLIKTVRDGFSHEHKH
jgi:signal peptidase II